MRPLPRRIARSRTTPSPEAPLDFEPRAIVIAQGEPSRGRFEIVAGAAMKFRTLPGGERIVLDFLAPGDVVGLPAGHPALVSVIAISPVTVRRVAEDPSSRDKRSHRFFIEELETTYRKVEMLMAKTALERVHDFLLGIAEAGGTSRIVLPMSRQEMASALGLTVETVARMLTKLRAAGRIAYRVDAPYDITLLNSGLKAQGAA